MILMGDFTKRLKDLKGRLREKATKSALCSDCQTRPHREEISISEIVGHKHFCAECWQLKLEQYERDKHDIAKQAQAKYDKLMRDVRAGMDPLEAWDRKGETDG